MQLLDMYRAKLIFAQAQSSRRFLRSEAASSEWKMSSTTAFAEASRHLWTHTAMVQQDQKLSSARRSSLCHKQDKPTVAQRLCIDVGI